VSKLIITIISTFVVFLSSVHARSESLNRITVFDLGYSTATKGFFALGYSRAITKNHLVSGYWKAYSEPYTNDSYGLNYKFFIDEGVTSRDSWFLSGNVQSGGIYKGDWKKMTTLSALGGYQWVYKSPFAITVESGVNANDFGDVYLTLVKFNFAYLF
jgi:hypothetical protein